MSTPLCCSAPLNPSNLQMICVDDVQPKIRTDHDQNLTFFEVGNRWTQDKAWQTARCPCSWHVSSREWAALTGQSGTSALLEPPLPFPQTFMKGSLVEPLENCTTSRAGPQGLQRQVLRMTPLGPLQVSCLLCNLLLRWVKYVCVAVLIVHVTKISTIGGGHSVQLISTFVCELSCSLVGVHAVLPRAAAELIPRSYHCQNLRGHSHLFVAQPQRRFSGTRSRLGTRCTCAGCTTPGEWTVRSTSPGSKAQATPMPR